VEGRPVSQSMVTMTELVLPSQTNSLSTVFGGVIMSWIDIAGAISAQRHSRRPVVTASIDALNFVAPAFVGWVINLKASVNFVAKSSMEVGVRADAENPIAGIHHHIASAYLTFVALGEDGKPTTCAPVIPETPEQLRRFEAARQRRDIRLKYRPR
jgi:acyl-CoA hydrolase